MSQRLSGAGPRENLTQVERDCLRVASQRSLRLFKPRSRRLPARWAAHVAGPHFFPGTIEALRRRRLLACEEFDGEARCFPTPDGLQLLAALPPDEPYEEISL